MNAATWRVVPVWNPYLPKGAAPVQQPSATAAATAAAARGIPRQVVYLPSCVTRMMGPSAGDDQTASVHEKLMSLFGKAGYEVRGKEGLWCCCGCGDKTGWLVLCLFGKLCLYLLLLIFIPH